MRDRTSRTGHMAAKGQRKRPGLLAEFGKSEDGNLVIFAVFMVLMILTMGGIGVDIMRSERDRTVLQHTLDRAVLAAADLDQERAPATVVNDYFVAAGLQDFLSSVDVDQGLNYKTIGAQAQSITTTAFMKLAGVDTLNATAAGVAEERTPFVEISMVLDISGSMADGNKMPELKTAATEFIDTVLQEGNSDRVSVSIVPYSEQVNAGAAIFNKLKRNHDHDYSHCIEFEHGDFSKSHLHKTQTYYQAQHFQWNYYGSNELTDTVCPRYSYEAIQPITNDATALKAQINQLQPRAGTQIHIGMNWGTALLDPEFRDISEDLVADGDMPSEFIDRPFDYGDPTVLKTIILMTDGKNSRSNRLKEPVYNSTSDYWHWNQYNLWYYLQRYVRSSKWSKFYYEKYSAAESDAYTQTICNVAKEKGIVIWSIGFEVDDHGASVMQDCASTPSHFFRVEGIEISEAFDAIARQINQLRLTQ